MAYQTGIFFSEGGNSLTFTPSATVVDERLQPAGSRSVDVAADETEIPVTHPVVLERDRGRCRGMHPCGWCL